MAHLHSLIDELVRGEDREFDLTVMNMDEIGGDSLARAWFTVKSSPNDTDAAAIFQKEITTSLTAAGRIDVPGGGSPIQNAHMFFNIPSSDTLKLEADIYYFYDVKALSSGNAKKVLESGRLIAVEQITRDES